VTQFSEDGSLFIPKKFQGFPEIKEALIADRMQAAFMVAPMAIALRSQGVPIKIVYLGHRYGSAVMVQKDGPIHRVEDLVGKTIAIPRRIYHQHMNVVKALRQHGLEPDQVKLIEMPPPDVAGALAVGAIDAFSMGEPFPSQTEMGGYGRMLFKAAEYWPDYMSCVVVVRQDVIDLRPGTVQALVDGIARSGLWLDEGVPNRDYASEFVGREYFQQPPELLRWVLTRDLERVIYSRLAPRQPDFDMVVELMLERGLLEEPIAFEEYVDTRFADGAEDAEAWDFGPGTTRWKR
jgi:NitT/TauT family transport system substrate-binding protein